MSDLDERGLGWVNVGDGCWCVFGELQDGLELYVGGLTISLPSCVIQRGAVRAVVIPLSGCRVRSVRYIRDWPW